MRYGLPTQDRPLQLLQRSTRSGDSFATASGLEQHARRVRPRERECPVELALTSALVAKHSSGVVVGGALSRRRAVVSPGTAQQAKAITSDLSGFRVIVVVLPAPVGPSSPNASPRDAANGAPANRRELAEADDEHVD
jgi:hypothetical protein